MQWKSRLKPLLRAGALEVGQRGRAVQLTLPPPEAEAYDYHGLRVGVTVPTWEGLPSCKRGLPRHPPPGQPRSD